MSTKSVKRTNKGLKKYKNGKINNTGIDSIDEKKRGWKMKRVLVYDKGESFLKIV